MIQGYQRKTTKFDWCGTAVWLRKITKAERAKVFEGENSAWGIDVLLLSLCNEDGSVRLTDRDAAIAYFDSEVAEADFADLVRLVIDHNGWTAEVQKKS